MVGWVGWVIIEIHKLLQFVIPKKKRKKERKKERKKKYENKKKNQDIRSYDIFYEITGS